MVRFALAVMLVATAATPAFADGLARTPQQIAEAVRQGCVVQHLHTQTGKNLHPTANVWCENRAAVAIAKGAPATSQRIASVD
jgi:hypothetical protein